MMNTTSSNMASRANAVFSRGEPSSRSVQRARTAGSGHAETDADADSRYHAHSQRPGQLDRCHQHGHAEHIDHGSGEQDTSLAHAVNRAAPERRNDSTSHRASGSKQTGQAERTRGQRYQQHDADAGHGQRQSGHEPGQAERHRSTIGQALPGTGEYLARRATPVNSRGCAEPTCPAVTPRSRGHDCPPRRQRSRVWMIALQLLITHQAAS